MGGGKDSKEAPGRECMSGKELREESSEVGHREGGGAKGNGEGLTQIQ